jgi:hypothetical protein
MLGLVVHTYSPSHWGGRGGRIICTHGFDSSLGNIARLHLKKKKIYIYIYKCIYKVDRPGSCKNSTLSQSLNTYKNA